MTDLSHALRAWKPAAARSSDRIDARQAAAFTALLDLRSPAGPVLPPLWHWFHFHDPVRRGELGDDGHPREAAFLPPIPHRRRMVAGGCAGPAPSGRATRSSAGPPSAKSR